MPPTAMATCTRPLFLSSTADMGGTSSATASLPSGGPPAAAPFRGVRSCLLMYSDEISRRTGVALVRAIAAGGRTGHNKARRYGVGDMGGGNRREIKRPARASQ